MELTRSGCIGETLDGLGFGFEVSGGAGLGPKILRFEFGETLPMREYAASEHDRSLILVVAAKPSQLNSMLVRCLHASSECVRYANEKLGLFQVDDDLLGFAASTLTNNAIAGNTAGTASSNGSGDV